MNETTTDIQKVIAERIKSISKKRNITIAELAEKTDKSIATINKYRNGTIMPPVDVLLYMASKKVFNCDIDYLLGIIPEETRKLSDVCEETGLDPDAANILKEEKYYRLMIYKDNDKMKTFDTLSWYISHGLIDILTDPTGILINDVYYIEPSIKSLPKAIRQAFEKIRKKTHDIHHDVFIEYIHELLTFDTECIDHIKRQIEINVTLQADSDKQDEELFNRFISEIYYWKKSSNTEWHHRVRPPFPNQETIEFIFIKTYKLLIKYIELDEKNAMVLFSFQNKMLDLLKEYIKETKVITLKACNTTSEDIMNYLNEEEDD